MTKKNKIKKAGEGTSPHRRRGGKCWHISRFQQRYELPDDVRFDRKSPLLFIKSFVGSGTDDESCSYFRQLMSLRAKPNWLLLRGAFAEIVNISANASKIYRGYLLDSNFQPAGHEQIGDWLGIKKGEAAKLLTELKRAGLIELVDMPDFQQKIVAVNNLVASRKTTRKHETARGGLNKRLSLNGNRSLKRNINKTVTTKAVAVKENNKHKSHSKNKTTAAPATALKPDKPKEADAGLGNVSHTGHYPSCSDNQPQKLGDLLRHNQHLFSEHAKEFGKAIYEALRVPHLPTSRDGCRELIVFAKCWQQAEQAGLAGNDLSMLFDKSLKDARRLGGQRNLVKFKKSPEAVFVFQFNRRLEYLSKQARAG